MHDWYANTYALTFKGNSLTLAPLPPPKHLKFKLGKESEKSLYISETPIKRAITKSKHLFVLLLVESNTIEEVKTLYLA